MTFNKAMEMLVEEYTKALEKEWVYNPVAYALYQTWKEADKRDRIGEEKCD